VPTPQGPHLTRPRSSQAPGSARRGVHLLLSVLTLPAVSNVSPAMMTGQLIAIQSARGRGHLAGVVAGPAVRDGLGAVEVGAADVGLVAQYPVQGRSAPHSAAAGGGGHGVSVEQAADLADGGPGGPLGEDPPHYRGLGLEDFQVRGAVWAAGDAPVAVGRLPGDHLAGAGAEQLAPPVPFADLGPLVLGDYALHLGEQPGLRVVLVEAGGIGEPHAHSEAGQLIEDEHLVGAGAGEPVRGQAPDHLEQPSLGGVTHLVQPGPVQPGPGAPVVAVLAGQLVPCPGHVRAQRLHPGTDRAPLGLPLGGHPGIDHGLHDHPSITWPPGAASTPAASSRS
jgi:hypothetical protein